MKKTTLLIAALIGLTGIAQAVQMSYYNNGWDKVTQTFDSGEFTPGIDTTYNILFKQFDTKGGKLTLQSVTIEYTLSAFGGYYAVDNDADTTASVTVQWGASGRLAANGSFDFSLPVGIVATSYATLSGSQSLSANQGDATGVYNSGNEGDKYRLDGSDASSPTTASLSKSRTTSLDGYLGTENLGFDYIANQASSSTQVGGVFYSGGPASADVTITVTYNYVPEPTSMALLAIGCAVLGLRRRPRNTLKG